MISNLSESDSSDDTLRPSIAERWQLIRGTNLKTEDRFFLQTLFLYQGEHDAAFCKQETIAREIGVSTRSVRISLKRLNEAGLVVSKWRVIRGVPMRTYAIQFDALKAVQRNPGRNHNSNRVPTHTRKPSSAREGTSLPDRPEAHFLQEDPLKIQGRSKPRAAFSRVSAKVHSVEDIATAQWMFDIVLKLQPEHKVPDLNKWANTVRLMRETDGRNDTEIRQLFLAADGDDFWQRNIRSPDKLRKQWDTLDLRFRKTKTQNGARADPRFVKVRSIIKRVWSPDLRNHSDAENAIGDADLFRAAMLTGLSAIADSDERDQFTPQTFTQHLESIFAQRKGTSV
jgi:hypothetical protein